MVTEKMSKDYFRKKGKDAFIAAFQSLKLSVQDTDVKITKAYREAVSKAPDLISESWGTPNRVYYMEGVHEGLKEAPKSPDKAMDRRRIHKRT
jgi:hypothetical protein